MRKACYGIMVFMLAIGFIGLSSCSNTAGLTTVAEEKTARMLDSFYLDYGLYEFDNPGSGYSADVMYGAVSDKTGDVDTFLVEYAQDTKGYYLCYLDDSKLDEAASLAKDLYDHIGRGYYRYLFDTGMEGHGIYDFADGKINAAISFYHQLEDSLTWYYSSTLDQVPVAHESKTLVMTLEYKDKTIISNASTKVDSGSTIPFVSRVVMDATGEIAKRHQYESDNEHYYLYTGQKNETDSYQRTGKAIEVHDTSYASVSYETTPLLIRPSSDLGSLSFGVIDYQEAECLKLPAFAQNESGEEFDYLDESSITGQYCYYGFHQGEFQNAAISIDEVYSNRIRYGYYDLAKVMGFIS